MRARVILTAFIVFGAVLQGCNTMAGVGQDMSKAGQAITNAADK